MQVAYVTREDIAAFILIGICVTSICKDLGTVWMKDAL